MKYAIERKFILLVYAYNYSLKKLRIVPDSTLTIIFSHQREKSQSNPQEQEATRVHHQT
jgi:hypothetical protein